MLGINIFLLKKSKIGSKPGKKSPDNYIDHDNFFRMTRRHVKLMK